MHLTQPKQNVLQERVQTCTKECIYIGLEKLQVSFKITKD